MKITILQGAFLPVPPLHGGAVEKLWFELGKQFASLGHDVVQVSRSHPDLPHQQQIEGVRHLRIRGHDMPANGLLLKLFDLLYSFRAILLLPSADILIINTFWMPILLRLPVQRKGLLVVSVERMPKGQMRLYGNVSCLLCCSQSVRQAVLRESPQSSSKAVIVPNPLPFVCSPYEDIPLKKRVILYSGRIHPEKGVDLLLRAFARACDLGLTGWSLRIVGPFEVSQGGAGARWFNSLQQLAGDSSNMVDWVGPIFDDSLLLQEYSQAAIFVYPSLADRGEAFGVAPLEAMAHGAVPIVSSLPCFSDFITHDHNGLVFNHHSADAMFTLADQLLQLTGDPVRLRHLSVQAFHVRQTHRPSVIATQMLDLFESLLVS